jgi:hypothetical protein
MLDLPEHPDGFLLGLMRLTELDCVCCCLEAGVAIGVLALRPDETWKPMCLAPTAYHVEVWLWIGYLVWAGWVLEEEGVSLV